MSTTYYLNESESQYTEHGWNGQGFHIMIINVPMSTTYILSEFKSPFTGHGWNGQGFHIMIISVYTWAQLTCWENPSHRPQGMIGMSKVFTLWSSVRTHEHNLLSEWIRVTVHRAWLEWAGFSHYDQHCTYENYLQPKWIQVIIHRAWLGLTL